MLKHLGLNKVASNYLKRTEQLDKLREIANSNNYPYKIEQLSAKIQEQYDFWTAKKPTQKLEDLTKDLTFIKSQVQSDFNKEKIDKLFNKYGLK